MPSKVSMLSCPETVRISCLAGVVVLAIGPCARPPAEDSRAVAAAPAAASAIDTVRAGSAAAAASWAWRRETSADLDADGAAEKVAIASDVTMGIDGAPLWEDGHRWAVFVETPAGRRTLLYSAFVPNGHAQAAVLDPDEGGRRRVLVEERTPSGLRVIAIGYPDAQVAEPPPGGQFAVTEWLPGPSSR